LYGFTAGQAPVLGRALVGAILIAMIELMPQGILGLVLKRFPRRCAPRPNSRSERAHLPERIRAPSPNSEPILVARGVSKAFRRVHALTAASADVRRAEVL